MVTERPYRSQLSGPEDLETTKERTRAGFVALALERSRQATPMVASARSLRVSIADLPTPSELAKRDDLRPALLSAAGVSDKAGRHLLPKDKLEAIETLIANFLEPAGAEFRDELVYRYLLTRDDALGGSMRNIGGVVAQQNLTRSLIAAISLSDSIFAWFNSSNGVWLEETVGYAGIELHAGGLAWQRAKGPRTLLYNRNVPMVGNNVDFVLLDCDYRDVSKALSDPLAYLSLGELKGGIDPAGADEHWKTASKALERIRTGFAAYDSVPALFYVGAAIARKMAREIWDELENGRLANAANLTSLEQVTSLGLWLLRL